MRICVYAICKNEEKFVDRWYNSMKEADEICVLDTGSTDNTVKLLKEKGVNVKQQIVNPWRFDVARNLSLDMISQNIDICVCTDLDEVFNAGWKKELLSIWKNNTTRCKYIYNWSLDKNNNPIVSFYSEKIHSRNNFKWINPVHEILECNKQENYITTDKIVLNHYPDNKKSRSSYLPLLELSIQENPNNDRNMHYLGREYMYYKKWHECIDTLIKHLNLPNSLWKDERCASMRFISRSYIQLNRFDEAKMWLEKAINEAPYLRDPYVEMALLQYKLGNFKEAKKYCFKALKIKYHAKTYINEEFSFDHTIYDLLANSCFYLDQYNASYKYINKALKISPDNERLIINKKIIYQKKNS